MTHAELTPDELACINCTVPGDCNPYHELCGNKSVKAQIKRDNQPGRQQYYAAKKAAREAAKAAAEKKMTRATLKAAIKRQEKVEFWTERYKNAATMWQANTASTMLRKMGVQV